MVYLHYRNLEEIDLPSIIKVEAVTVVIPRITIRELDKHKNINLSSRIRERARQRLKKIENWMDTGENVRSRIEVEFFHKVPDINYAQYGLTSEWNDDILIASIIQYKEMHPNEKVILITQDTGLKLMAIHLGIEVYQIPDELKLPEELDPLEAENRELSRNLARLENTIPKIIVFFAGSDPPETHKRFVLQPPPESIEDEIKRKIEELIGNLPKLPGQILKTVLMIPSEEYDRYNREIDEYISEYDKYLRESWEIHCSLRRSIRFQFEIRNIGTSPADDVDVLFNFPDGFQLYTNDNLPKIPKKPRPPRQPRTNIEMLSDMVIDVATPPSQFRALSDINRILKEPSSFTIKRTNSYSISDQFRRIKHGDCVLLPELFLIFDSYESANSFSCEFIIRPANLPDAITGQLHFVIDHQKKEENQVTDIH